MMKEGRDGPGGIDRGGWTRGDGPGGWTRRGWARGDGHCPSGAGWGGWLAWPSQYHHSTGPPCPSPSRPPLHQQGGQPSRVCAHLSTQLCSDPSAARAQKGRQIRGLIRSCCGCCCWRVRGQEPRRPWAPKGRLHSPQATGAGGTGQGGLCSTHFRLSEVNILLGGGGEGGRPACS